MVQCANVIGVAHDPTSGAAGGAKGAERTSQSRDAAISSIPSEFSIILLMA
jgi:hypothetical protein